MGSPSRMKEVAEIVNNSEEQKIVVLSAVSGTTNKLVEITSLHANGKSSEATSCCEELRAEYTPFVEELLSESKFSDEALRIVDQRFEGMRKLLSQNYSDKTEKLILAEGEIISTNLFHLFLSSIGKDSYLLNALDFMALDEQEEPNQTSIKMSLSNHINGVHNEVIVTQGYICRNHRGQVDNLKRGGSDYTATLIGAALKSSEVQIWTDIDGVHNNDPRVVENTMPIAELSFDEAGELAYFGAKILHPSCILPAQQGNVPVRIKNTLVPQAPGTLITSEKKTDDIKAIAVKDGITAIKIKSTRMINAYGFLKKVFEVFEKYETPIDMITTSEIAVSLTIDKPGQLENIVHELRPFGMIEIDKDQSIICIVGNFVAEKKGIVKKVFSCLDDIPVRMISYGGSKNNISVLIDSNYKAEALINLNRGVFGL